MYEKEMKSISDLMKKRLEEKHAKHGDEWKIVSIEQLQEAIDFIHGIYHKRKNTDKEIIALTDIANQAMLLCLRLKSNKDVLE